MAAIFSDTGNFFHSSCVIAEVFDNVGQYHAIVDPGFIGESS